MESLGFVRPHLITIRQSKLSYLSVSEPVETVKTNSVFRNAI
jgi:hypothetical protein